MRIFPPAARRSPDMGARTCTDPPKRRVSPSIGAIVMTEPPPARKSPDTGAVSTTEAPAAYAFPGEELATRSELPAENVDGARAAKTLVGIHRATRRMRIVFFIPTPRAASLSAVGAERESSLRVSATAQYILLRQ